MSSRVWWVLPALSVLLGALLGLVNLDSPDANGWLRVPGPARRADPRRPGPARLRERPAGPGDETATAAGSTLPALNPSTPPVVLNPDDVVVHESRPQSGAVALEQAIQAQQLAAQLVAGTAVRESRGAVVAVLVLAVWLGLATLTYSNAPAALLRLSLLASFLLFASAWSMLQKRSA